MIFQKSYFLWYFAQKIWRLRRHILHFFGACGADSAICLAPADHFSHLWDVLGPVLVLGPWAGLGIAEFGWGGRGSTQLTTLDPVKCTSSAFISTIFREYSETWCHCVLCGAVYHLAAAAVATIFRQRRLRRRWFLLFFSENYFSPKKEFFGKKNFQLNIFPALKKNSWAKIVKKRIFL